MNDFLVTRRGLLGLAALTAPALGVGARSVAAAPDPSAGHIPAELPAFIRSYLPAVNAPGIVVALADRGGTLGTDAFGVADLGSRAPMRPDHLVQIGSITKSFVALVMLQLQDEGRIDLQAPLREALPDLPIDTGFGTVTLHHVLTHSSGMPGEAPVWPADENLRLEQRFAPGSRFEYCNWGYDVLGCLIERIERQPWKDVVTRRIFAPLGMTQTHGVLSGAIRDRYPVSYTPVFDDRPVPRHSPLVAAPLLTYAGTAGCIASTVADMARYLTMLLNRGEGPQGRLISAKAFELFSTPHIKAEEFGPEASYGYGIAIDRLDGRLRLRHTGGMVSFVSSLMVDLDAGVAAFASANVQLGYRPNPVTEYALRLLHAKRAAAPPPARPDLDAEFRVDNAQDYTGTYTAPDGHTIVIGAAERQLTARIGSRVIALERSEPDVFIALDRELGIYPLVFGRARDASGKGPVVDLGHGADWFAHARFDGPRTNERPTALRAYEGVYFRQDPWESSAPVVARRGRLWLGGTTPLRPVGGHAFRVGDDPAAVATVTFRRLVDERARVLDLDGVAFDRVADAMEA